MLPSTGMNRFVQQRRLGLIRTIGHQVRRLPARDAGPHLRYQQEE